MYHIALVQNQSEMANYSHADCRKFLIDEGYSHTLFTATNIDQLSGLIDGKGIDALIIASNALHDKIIRQFFDSETGKNIIAKLIVQNCGILIFMQYKAAYDNYSFDFLPNTLGEIKAIARPDDETATDANLELSSTTFQPPLVKHPNEVVVSELQGVGVNHSTLRGVYWHFWGGVSQTSWDLHVFSKEGDAPRPLVISAKEHMNTRIVLSALPLDWQGDRELFQNIISYIVEGRHDTAILQGAQINSTAFNYFVATIRARKQGFSNYSTDPSQLNALQSNLEKEIHKTLVLAPQVSTDNFPDSLSKTISKLLKSGKLRIVKFSEQDGGALAVEGRRNPVSDIYRLIVPTISADMINGYLDGSFLSTITALQEIRNLPLGLDFELFPLAEILMVSDKHDRSGSYDEVFGATSALLWLRAVAYGRNHEKTIATEKWLKERLQDTDEREKIKALSILKSVDMCSPNEEAMAVDIFTNANIERATEIELLSLLEGAVVFNETKAISLISAKLYQKQKQIHEPTVLVDIPTTASFVKTLLFAYEKLSADSLSRTNSNSSVLSNIREMIVPAMISIEESFQRSILSQSTVGMMKYPWDGKAATSLRCLSAWFAFDQFLSAPVEEAAETVKRVSYSGYINSISESGLSSLKKFIEMNKQFAIRLEEADKAFDEKEHAISELNKVLAHKKKAIQLLKFFAFIIISLLYLMGPYIFAAPNTPIWNSMDKDDLPVLGVLFAALAVPWSKLLKPIERLVSRELRS